MLGMLPQMFKNVKYNPVIVLASIIWCRYTKQNDNNLNIID